MCTACGGATQVLHHNDVIWVSNHLMHWCYHAAIFLRCIYKGVDCTCNYQLHRQYQVKDDSPGHLIASNFNNQGKCSGRDHFYAMNEYCSNFRLLQKWVWFWCRLGHNRLPYMVILHKKAVYLVLYKKMGLCTLQNFVSPMGINHPYHFPGGHVHRQTKYTLFETFFSSFQTTPCAKY